ncbi:MAG: beta strand repeat-containing protein [Phormidesmis sp.]
MRRILKRTESISWLRRQRNRWILLGLSGTITLLSQSTASAQTSVTNLNATYQAGSSSTISTTNANPCNQYSPCDAPVTLNFGTEPTDDLVVSGFNAGTDTYSLIQLSDLIQFQRIDNAGVTGERQLMFFERTGSNTNLRSSYVNSMEEGILSNISNRGIDNAFSNQAGDVASNNIERIDFVISGGLTVPSVVQGGIGFLIMERGGNDPFNIAAITSIDASGNPTSFGNLVRVETSAWGATGFNIDTSVMRREENESLFRPSHTVGGQNIEGVFLSLTDLGFSSGETIYGYALFPNDINSSNDLLNLTDFPTDTSGQSGEGGLDLVAGGGIYLLDSIQSLSGTLYEDSNGDDSFTGGETTLPNAINVILYQDTINPNGTYDVGEEIQTVTTSGGNGGYTVAGVADGTYRIFVDTGDADIPTGLSLGTPNDIQVVVSGSDVTGLDFGFEATEDYGDAPDTYGTDATAGNSTSGSDPVGASHTVGTSIFLGTNPPDAETDAVTPLDGSGDGTDEDGITLEALSTGDPSYQIPVGNITATGSGTLHAWVDFNRDGTFESDEYSSTTINSGVPTRALNWTGITVGAAGDTYARFRFTSDASITASTPGGAASNGEVEDYQLTIAASSTGPRFACNTIAYNVIGTPSEFNTIDPSTLAITPLSTPTSPNFDPAVRLNGIAFNPLDNYIYALVSDPQSQAGYATHDFIRVSSDGTLENLGPATAVGNPSIVMTGNTSSTDNGTMDGNGNYYNLENGTTLRKVSIGSTPTANSLTFEEITITGLGTKPWDLSFNPVDGFLYGIGNGTLYRIDPDTGIATTVSTTGEALPPTAGGSWANSAGVSYFYKNASGGNNNLFAVDLTQSPAVVTIVGAVPQDGQFNATSCTPPELTKDENLDTVNPGDTVTYTYTLFNGFGTDIFVNFEDTLTDPNITYNAGTLSTTAPGGGSVTQFDNTQLSISNILVPTGVGGGVNSVMFTVEVTVSNSALDGTVVSNQARTTFGASTILSDDPETGPIDDPTTFNVVASNDPNLLLVKRITAINRGEANEQLLENRYVDGGTNNDADNADFWPGGTEMVTVGSGTVQSYIAGIINGADSSITIDPADTIEYTISFLSNGAIAAQDVLVCDRIPTNTTFLSTAFDSSTPASPGSGNRGILIEFNGSQVALTNANDGDEIPDSGGDTGVGGYYFAPGVDPSTVFPDISCNGTSDNGTVVVDLSDIPNATSNGTPTNSYGFIRFRVTLD